MALERVNYFIEVSPDENGDPWVHFFRSTNGSNSKEYGTSARIYEGIPRASWPDPFNRINSLLVELYEGKMNKAEAQVPIPCSDIDCGYARGFGDYTLIWRPR